MGGACSTHEGDYKLIQNFLVLKFEEKRPRGRLSVGTY
jgi:hypothetical protein